MLSPLVNINIDFDMALGAKACFRSLSFFGCIRRLKRVAYDRRLNLLSQPELCLAEAKTGRLFF